MLKLGSYEANYATNYMYNIVTIRTAVLLQYHCIAATICDGLDDIFK